MKNYFFSNLSALNTDLNYAVDAASSLSGYATKSDMLVATTHINDLSSSLSGTQVQMALYDGRFALPETVVEYEDGTVKLFDLQPTSRIYPNGNYRGSPRSTTISSYFESLSAINGGNNPIRKISFGKNLPNDINFTPFYDAPEISADTQDVRTYLVNDLSANVLSADLKSVVNVLQYLNSITISNADEKTFQIPVLPNDNYAGYYFKQSSIEIKTDPSRYQFYGWRYLKEIHYTGPAGGTMKLGAQFINHCPNLELVDLRGPISFLYDAWTFFNNRAAATLVLPLIIEEANPNLKVIVNDEAYPYFTTGTWATAIQPYLVKASEWEYAHSSDLSSYATENYVDMKIGDINTILDSVNGQII